MRSGWLLCAALGSTLWAQTGASPGSVQRPANSRPAQPAAEPENDQPPVQPAPDIPMDATVLTIKGFCPEQKAGPNSQCQTAITRAQFEAIAAAIQPTMNVVVKRQLASLLPRLLVMTHEAQVEGLDKDPQYEQRMAYARMQILTQALTRKLQGDSAKVSESDIASYYHQNLEMFQVYTLQRLFVPLHKQAPDNREKPGVQAAETTGQNSARQAAEEQEMATLAEALRARAAAGEDFVALQKEAFSVARVKVAAPNTSMGKVRRTSIPSAHRAALDLKTGDVSRLISDPAGHYVYKLEAREQLTLEQVQDEIRGTLSSERMKDAMDKIQNSYTTDTNDAYFQSHSESGNRRSGNAPPDKP